MPFVSIDLSFIFPSQATRAHPKYAEAHSEAPFKKIVGLEITDACKEAECNFDQWQVALFVD